MTAELQNPIFQDADKARSWLESHLWAEGPVCGYCGAVTEATAISTRPGYYQCNACRKQFTVMVGTLFERSHVPLNKWLMAAFLLCASKKGISAHQMHRMLGITYKSAWFMMHRLREAMNDKAGAGPMGGPGTTIEADETYFMGGAGPNKGARRQRKIVTLVERGGASRSFKVEDTTAKTVRRIIQANVAKGGAFMTDESGIYTGIGSWSAGHFKSHGKTMHSAGQYVSYDDPNIHSNTVEGFFSIFKRGMKGIYQHCGEQHLQRYLNEFDFRYSNRKIEDKDRTELALKGIVGKRLTYRRTNLGTNV